MLSPYYLVVLKNISPGWWLGYFVQSTRFCSVPFRKVGIKDHSNPCYREGANCLHTIAKSLRWIIGNPKNESQKILDECSSIATKKGIAINTTLLEGNPASTILEFSQMEKYEVIIIGSRGMGHFKELILGSVSSKILHHSLCPVLLIR